MEIKLRYYGVRVVAQSSCYADVYNSRAPDHIAGSTLPLERHFSTCVSTTPEQHCSVYQEDGHKYMAF